MPPRKRAKKPSAPATEEVELITREATRLRTRAEGHLLEKHPSIASTTLPPPSLRRCDGVDIVKRNTSRKKKYLLVFPGAASLPPGATVGTLAGLNTRTPTLDVDVPPLGRIRLTGSLVFPKNCFTAIKTPASKKKPVQVVDTFQTLLVFSEWAWVGDEKANPAGLPEPLPMAVRRRREEGEALWKTHRGGKGDSEGKGKGEGDKDKLKAGEPFVVEDTDDMDEVQEIEEDDVAPVVDDADEEDWDRWESTFSGSVADKVQPRSNPRRKRKRVSYVDDEDEDGVEELDENCEDEVQVVEDVVNEVPNDDEDDPGYDLEADLFDSGGNATF